MIKRIVINILLIVVACIIPLHYFDIKQNDSRAIDSIQFPIFLILFIGAGLLTYLNHRFRKQALEKKWAYLIFETIGIIGLIYSAGILWLLWEFRNGIGF